MSSLPLLKWPCVRSIVGIGHFVFGTEIGFSVMEAVYQQWFPDAKTEDLSQDASKSSYMGFGTLCIGLGKRQVNFHSGKHVKKWRGCRLCL
jgi:hypothetical protein